MSDTGKVACPRVEATGVAGQAEADREAALSAVEEARRIYRAIFRRWPPQVIVARFVVASRLLDQGASLEDLQRYRGILRTTGDLEALEVACRYTRRVPLLVAKFQLMVFLAETLPENQDFFLNEETRRLRACFALARGALMTAFKLGKGVLLLARSRYV